MKESARVLLFILPQICCGSGVRAQDHSINVDVSLYIQGSSDGEAYQIQYGTVKDDIPKLYYDSRNLNVFLIPDLNETLDELIGPLVNTEETNLFTFYYEEPSNVQSMTDTDKMVVITKGAELMTKFIRQLSKVLSMNLDSVELIGYGGGAHIAGIIGDNLKSKIKSIVALDPSHPVYNMKDNQHVLDPADAKNVHVIHTSGGTSGLYGNTGTSDFYPNGGMSQPGCEGDKSGVCSHHRAVEYYIESLKKGNVFVCFKCSGYKYVKSLSLEMCHEYGLLGRLVPDDRMNGTHYCITKPNPPYLYSLVPDPNEGQSQPTDVTVSNEASSAFNPPQLHSTDPNEGRSNSPDVAVPTEALPMSSQVPELEVHIGQKNTSRITNVYVVKDLASQLENELEQILDCLLLQALNNAEYTIREITILVGSVQKYVFRGMGRLFSHIPGNDLEQVIADLQALNQDVGYLLDIGRTGLQQGPKQQLLQQFSDKLDKLLQNTRGVLEHLKQVIKQPDFSFTELEITQGMIIDLAGRLKPDMLDEDDLSKLIYTVQTYLQLIAELVSSSSIEMRPGDGADEYRGLIQELVKVFKLLNGAVKFLLEMLKKGDGPSPSLIEVKLILVGVEQRLLIVAEPVSQVTVHLAIPSPEPLNIKETLETALALFLETIERSVNWPLSKVDLVKIPVRIEALIATILNKLHLQLFVSPNLKVNRIVEEIAGELKVLAQIILALVNHGQDGSFAVADLVEILQKVQEVANTINADLQKIYSIDVLVLNVELLSKSSSVLQELTDELILTLQQLRETALAKPDLYQLTWKAEKFFIHTALVIYGSISRPSGFIYEDVFERLRIILNRFSQLVNRVERLAVLIFQLDQNEILPPGNYKVAEIIDLTREVSKISSDIVVFMGYPVQGGSQQPPLLDLQITLQETTIEILTKYLQVPAKYDYNELELAQSTIIIEEFVNNILNGLPQKYSKFLPAVSPESTDILQSIVREIDVLQQMTYLVVKQTERSTLKLNVPGGFQRLEVKDLEDAIASVERISELVSKVSHDTHLYFGPVYKEMSNHQEAILKGAKSFLNILEDSREMSALTVAKVIFHVQSYMTVVLEGIYGPSKEDNTCRITNIIFHYKHLLEAENDILDWIDTKQVSNKKAYNYLRNFKITSSELSKCLKSTDPDGGKSPKEVQLGDIGHVAAGLIAEIISARKSPSLDGSIDFKLLFRFHGAIQVLVTNVLDGFQLEIRDNVLAHLYKQVIELLKEVHQLVDTTDNTKLTMVLNKITEWINQLLKFSKQRPQLKLLSNIMEKALQLVWDLQVKPEQISAKLILDKNLMTELIASLQKAVIHIVILEGINFPTDILRIIEVTDVTEGITITSTSPDSISDIIEELEILYDILLSLNLSTTPHFVSTTTLLPSECDLSKYNEIIEALQEISLSIGSLMRLVTNPPISANQMSPAKEKASQMLNKLSSTVLSDLSYCYPSFKTQFPIVEGLLPLIEEFSQLLSKLVKEKTPIQPENVEQLVKIMNQILEILGANPSLDTSTVSSTTMHVCDSNNYYEKIETLKDIAFSARELVQIIGKPSASSIQINFAKDRIAQLLKKLPSTTLPHLFYCYPELTAKLPDFEGLLPLVEVLAQLLLVQEQSPILHEILVELIQAVDDILKILGVSTSADMSTVSPPTMFACDSTACAVSPPPLTCDSSKLHGIIAALRVVLVSMREFTNFTENHNKVPKVAVETTVQRIVWMQKSLGVALLHLRSCGALSKRLFDELVQLEATIEEVKQLLPHIVDNPSEKSKEVLKEVIDVFELLLVVLQLRTPSPVLVSTSNSTALITTIVPPSPSNCGQTGTYNVLSSFRAVIMSITELANVTDNLNVPQGVIETSVQKIVKQLVELQNVLQYMRSCNPELGPILSGIEPLLVMIEDILRTLPGSGEKPSSSFTQIVGKVVEISTIVWKIIIILPVQSNPTIQLHVNATEFNGTLELIKYLLDLTHQPQVIVYPHPSEATSIYAPPSCKSNNFSTVFQHLSGILLIVKKIEESLASLESYLSPEKIQVLHEELSNHLNSLSEVLNCSLYLYPQTQWDRVRGPLVKIIELLGNITQNLEQMHSNPEGVHRVIVTLITHIQLISVVLGDCPVSSISCDFTLLQGQVETILIKVSQVVKKIFELLKQQNPQLSSERSQELAYTLTECIHSLSKILKCSSSQLHPSFRIQLEKIVLLLETLTNSLQMFVFDSHLQPTEIEEVIRQLLRILEIIAGTTEGTSTTSVAPTLSELPSCDPVVLQEQVKTIVLQLRQLISQTVELEKNLIPQQRQQEGQQLENELRKFIVSLVVILKCSPQQLPSDLQTTLEKVVFTLGKLTDSLDIMILNPLVPWEGPQVELIEIDKLFSQLLLILTQLPGTPTTQIPDRGSELLETKEALQSVTQVFEVLWRLVRDPNASQGSVVQTIQLLSTNMKNLIVVIKRLDSSDLNLLPLEIRDIIIAILFDFKQMTPILETFLMQLDKIEALHMVPEELKDILNFIFKYLQQLQQLVLTTLGENPEPYVNVEKSIELIRELLVIVVHVAEFLRNPDNSNMTEGITQLLVVIQRYILETANFPNYLSTQDSALIELILQLQSLADKLREFLDTIGNASVSGEASAELVVFLNMITEYGYKILQLQPSGIGVNQKQLEDVLQLLQRLNEMLQKVAQGGIPNTNDLTELHLVVQRTVALIYVLYDSPIGTKEYGPVEQLKALPPVFEVFLKLSKGCTNGGSCNIQDLMKVITMLMKQIEQFTIGSPNTSPSVVSIITPLGQEIAPTTTPSDSNAHANKVIENVKLYVRQIIEIISKIINDPDNLIAEKDLYALVQELLNYINSLPNVYLEEGPDDVSSNILIQMLKGSITIFEELLNVLDCVISRCKKSSYGELVELLNVILRITKSLPLVPDVPNVAAPPDPQLKQHMLDIYEITEALIAKMSVSNVVYGDIAHLVEQLDQIIEKYIKLSTSEGETARYFRRFNALLQFLSEYFQSLPNDLNVDHFTSILRVITEFISKVPDLFTNTANPSSSFDLIDLVTRLGSQLKKIVEVDSTLLTFSNQTDSNSVLNSTLNKLVAYINEYFTIINQAPNTVPNNQPPKLVKLFVEAKNLVTVLEEVLSIARTLLQEGPLQANLDRFKQLLKMFRLTGESAEQCMTEQCWRRSASEDETWQGDDSQVIQTIQKTVGALLEALEDLAQELKSKRSKELNLTKFTKAVNTYILAQQNLPNHLSNERLDVVLTHYTELGPYLETALGLMNREGQGAHTLLVQFLNLTINHAKQVMQEAELLDRFRRKRYVRRM